MSGKLRFKNAIAALSEFGSIKHTKVRLPIAARVFRMNKERTLSPLSGGYGILELRKSIFNY